MMLCNTRLRSVHNVLLPLRGVRRPLPGQLRRLARPKSSSSPSYTQARQSLLLSPKTARTKFQSLPQQRLGVTRRNKSSLADQMASKSSSGYISSRVDKNPWLEALGISLRKTRTIPIPRWISPRQHTITFSEVLGHSSFLLVAISYAVDDFLLLRCIAVAGSTAMLFFTYFHPHGRVLWLPFKWNLLFIALNSYRIGRALWHSYHAEGISDELVALRENFLFIFPKVDYYKLIRLGTIKTVKKGDVLVTQGERNRYVRLLISGELRVLRDGKLNYVLEEANFVSESGLHAGLLIPGSVESCCTIVADTDSRLVVWDRTALVALLTHDESVRRSLQAAISWDVVRKLKFQRNLISRGLIDDPEAWTIRRMDQTQHRYAGILQNLLLHPKLLEDRKRSLEKYRMIHHIDDNMHDLALKSCGWTQEEYERGYRNKRTDNDDMHSEDDESIDDRYFVHRDWKWHARNLYYRMFG